METIRLYIEAQKAPIEEEENEEIESLKLETIEENAQEESEEEIV